MLTRREPARNRYSAAQERLMRRLFQGEVAISESG